MSDYLQHHGTCSCISKPKFKATARLGENDHNACNHFVCSYMDNVTL